MQSFISDLKYLGHLNRYEFEELLFPNSVGDYASNKWLNFKTDLFSFLCSCSDDKIELLTQYIEEEKGGI
jgi:hypothetical protein